MEGESDRREDGDAPEGQSDGLDAYRDEIRERYPDSSEDDQGKVQPDSAEVSDHVDSASDTKFEEDTSETELSPDRSSPPSNAEEKSEPNAGARSGAADDYDRTAEHSEPNADRESQSDLEQLREDVREKYPQGEAGEGDAHDESERSSQRGEENTGGSDSQTRRSDSEKKSETRGEAANASAAQAALQGGGQNDVAEEDGEPPLSGWETDAGRKSAPQPEEPGIEVHDGDVEEPKGPEDGAEDTDGPKENRVSEDAGASEVHDGGGKIDSSHIDSRNGVQDENPPREVHSDDRKDVAIERPAEPIMEALPKHDDASIPQAKSDEVAERVQPQDGVGEQTTGSSGIDSAPQPAEDYNRNTSVEEIANQDGNDPGDRVLRDATSDHAPSAKGNGELGHLEQWTSRYEGAEEQGLTRNRPHADATAEIMGEKGVSSDLWQNEVTSAGRSLHEYRMDFRERVEGPVNTVPRSSSAPESGGPESRFGKTSEAVSSRPSSPERKAADATEGPNILGARAEDGGGRTPIVRTKELPEMRVESNDVSFAVVGSGGRVGLTSGGNPEPVVKQDVSSTQLHKDLETGTGKRPELHQIRENVGEAEEGKVRESQMVDVGKQVEHKSPIGESNLNGIYQKFAKTGDTSQQGYALTVEPTSQGSIRIQHDDKRDNLQVSGRDGVNKTRTNSDDGLKSEADSLRLSANLAEGRNRPNDGLSIKGKAESVRVAGDENKSQNQLDSPDRRQAVLFLAPHFTQKDSLQFCLAKSTLETQMGMKLEAGKLVEIKGRVEGIYQFDEYRLLSESHRIFLHVPKEYIKEMRAGEKKQITIVSIEDKNISASVREILSHLKRGQNWRFVSTRTTLSSETTPNDLKYLTEPRVPRHRLPLEESLRNNQGVSNERWKMYLGKLIERELSHSIAKESGNLRDVSQIKSETMNRNKTEVPNTTSTIKRNPNPQEVAPRREINDQSRARGASASAEQTKSVGTNERNGDAQVARRQNEIRSPKSWEWVAGFFDGEGSIILNVRKYSISIEVTFAQKYTPLLDSVRGFLNDKGIKSSVIYSGGRADRLSIHSTEEAASVLREMLPYLSLKENQARAALDYLEDRINGRELVQIFNQEVEAGRRSGYARTLPDHPLHRSESIRRSREAQMKNAHRALHSALDRLDGIPEV